MKTELYLQIPKPCRENWDAMTPVDKGKFCASCSKEVVDFSLLSDVEVLNFFKKSTGNTCGRFNPDQLQRPLQETKIEKKKGWKWVMASITWLIMTSKSNAQKKEACTAITGKVKIVQPKKETGKELPAAVKPLHTPSIKSPSKPKPPMMIVGAVSLIIPDGDIRIKGIVLDENNNPIPNTIIRTANNSVQAFTDNKGYFEVPVNSVDGSVSFLFSSFGFIDEQLLIDLTKDQSPLRIIMKPKITILPEVTVITYRTKIRTATMGDFVTYSPVTKKDTVAALIRKIADTVSALRIFGAPLNILVNPLKIYPNPTIKNSIIHLSIKDAGNYQVQLFDNTSRLLHAEENTTTAKQQAVNLQLPQGVSSGVYYIRLINVKTKKSYVEKLIVQ